jgi:hypothetical protein
VLSLAVGMETLPYVAVAGLCVATRLLIGGRAHAALAAGFGAAFAAAAAIAFVATVPASAWLSAECDAYSIPQFAIAAIAGAGLAAAAGNAPGTIGQAVGVSPGAKVKNVNVFDPDGIRLELNEYIPESLPKKAVDSWQ